MSSLHTSGWWMAWALPVLLGLGCEPADRATEPVSEVEPVRAADFRSEMLSAVIEKADAALGTRGYSPATDTWRGFLVDRDAAVNDASMQAGTCYVVVGISSTALRELELRVFDSDGGEVARDQRTGRGAALHYCPPQSGTYYTAVRAAAGNGLFAVRRYRGPTGLDIRLDDLFGEPEPERP